MGFEWEISLQFCATCLQKGKFEDGWLMKQGPSAISPYAREKQKDAKPTAGIACY